MIEQVPIFAQSPLQSDIEKWVTSLQPIYEQVGVVRLSQIKVLPKVSKVDIYLNGSSACYLYRDEFVNALYKQADSIVHHYYPSYKSIIYADKKEISTLVPNYYRQNRANDVKRFANKRLLVPIVKNVSLPYDIDKGLVGRNIALWSSHGLYYDQKDDRWKWQRSRLFETVEDKLTLDYILNFLVPMLENAGANVFLPHERDTQTEEVIIDNDITSATSLYEEKNEQWSNTSLIGWGLSQTTCIDGQNPFAMGTCRQTKSKHAPSTSVRWTPSFQKSGEYAVYISYQSFAESVSDARYTVCHAGGKTDFFVNQKQGGGTWIYLGTFYFEANTDIEHSSLVLTNESAEEGKIVTADAARFGGGVGNIARRPACDSDIKVYNATYNKKVDIPSCSGKKEYVTSGFPRYLEASRYWLQWAGFPKTVYSRTHGIDDYSDDVASRGLWVNCLNNGSENAPDSIGLNVPIDMAFALHTDAGFKGGDTIVGSLGICLTKDKTDKFLKGQSRATSRDLSDMVLSEISKTIRTQYDSAWTMRGVWDKSYIEARLPQVPTMLLELLSHQNITDMRYALDPSFQFAVSRAIYKAIARYLSFQNFQECNIAPLPINSFCAELVGRDSTKLVWRATSDTLEYDGALPSAYVVYTRIQNGGFDNGILVEDTTVTLPIKRGVKYDYKVVAVNSGGASFPSEILSVCNVGNSNRILIINGFTKVSAPSLNNSKTGFSNFDWIPYGKSLAYTGPQYNFDTSSVWNSNDAPGWGASSPDYETKLFAGNSLDYPSIHGSAILNAGYSYASCSLSAIEYGMVELKNYAAIDLILGAQFPYICGTDSMHYKYETFPDYLQDALMCYASKGGAMFVSGSHVASSTRTIIDEVFLKKYLKIKLLSSMPLDGEVEYAFSSIVDKRTSLFYNQTPNELIYNVTVSDAFIPQGNSFPFLRYKKMGICAAIAAEEPNKVIVMGLPFETIKEESSRNSLAAAVFNFLMNKK